MLATLLRPALRLAHSSGSILKPGPRFCTTTKPADLPKMVALVHDKKDEWAALPAASKAKLLGEMLQIFSTMDHEAWAREALRAEGYDAVQPDILVGVEMIKNTRLISADIENLIETIATCADHKSRPEHGAGRAQRPMVSSRATADCGTRAHHHPCQSERAQAVGRSRACFRASCPTTEGLQQTGKPKCGCRAVEQVRNTKQARRPPAALASSLPPAIKGCSPSPTHFICCSWRTWPP